MHRVTTPLLLNALYEISFWANIQYEHTIVLTENIPNMPINSKRELLAMRKQWKHIKNQAESLMEAIGNHYHNRPIPDWYDRVWKLTLESQKANKEFIDFLMKLARSSKHDDTVQLLIHHIYEESQYFMRILNTIHKLLSA